MEETCQLHRSKKVQPSKKASFLSTLFFCWAPPIFYKSYRRKVTEEYYQPLKSHNSQHLGDKVEDAWNVECRNKENPSLWCVLTKTFSMELVCLVVVFVFPEAILKMSQPWLIGKLMTYHDFTSIRSWKDSIYFYGFLLILANLLGVMVGHWYQLKIQHLGMKIRIACCSLIYRKSLKISVNAASNVGNIINLLSNDVNRFDLGPMHTVQLVRAPIETLFVIYCLYTNVGPTSIAGIVVLVLFIPTQMYMGRLTTQFRQRTATKTDHRIKLMDEILIGIEVIKMFTWEKLFTRKITQARKQEIRQILKISFIRAFNVSAQIFLNRLGIFFCILAYALTQKEINARYVFVVSSYYNILRQALTVYLPFGIQGLSESRVSVRRIQKFLSTGEDNTTSCDEEKEHLMKNVFDENTNEMKSRGILLGDVSVKWLPSSENFTLDDINLEISENELVVIAGPVGSGKSTLLYTILKELPLSRGKVSVGGTISYSSQDPWLFSGSIRQNILFGSNFDPDKYDKVVQISQLEKDFSDFPNGDESLVGERGSLLSGGQKSRVTLARALYKDADIYLLDDPLASVDATVAQKIFQDCILQYLKNKCRVLVTHNTNYLIGTADRIYTLDRGRLVNVTHQKLDLIDKDNRKSYTPHTKVNGKNSKMLKDMTHSGRKSKDIYKKYMQAGGSNITNAFVVLLFILTQTAASGADYFVAFWSNLNGKDLFNTCIIIYVAIITATVVLSLTRSFVFFRYCLKAATNLHKQMFARIIRAPMVFYKTTPSGQILNRFSKDLGLIDETLPVLAMDTFQIAAIVLGSLLLVSSVNPWMLFPSAAVFFLFYLFKIIFLTKSRNIKRLEAEARSPIYSHMHATLQGLPTIRTFNVQKVLKEEFDHYQNLHSSAFYFFMTCNRAFGIWLDMTCAMYTAVAITATLLMDRTAGDLGLSITQSINLIGVLQWGIRQWSELENQMISVERVIEYTEISQESDLRNGESLQNWPTKGEIKFESVSLKYFDKICVSLDNINLLIKSGQKTGIVGRTGGGKSSLISTLFRLYDTKGSLSIDDVNIKDLSLDDLRSKISIIPQQPILFTGSLRDNIDPYEEYEDHVIWQVLEDVELKDAVAQFPKNLHHEILRNGSNLSVGQRQLICLARAILRDNKILIMDEATADVDPKTESAIYQTIENRLQDCTILIVAHRLSNVMDLDKVVVMEDGKVVEFGSPDELLKDSEGVFAQLMNKHDETRGEAIQQDKKEENS